MGLILRIVVIIFGALVVVGAVVFLVLEAMDKVEAIQKRAPWIEKVLQRRDALVVLLLIAVVLLLGDGYELWTKELPEASEPPKVTFPSADSIGAGVKIAELERQIRELGKAKATRPAKTTAQSSNPDDPTISLSCVNTVFPGRIPPGQYIDAAMLMPGIKSGLDRVDNSTKFSKSWPRAQMPIGGSGIKCDAENHGDESATVSLTFLTYFRGPQAAPPGVEKKRLILLEPIDAKQTRTFYLANWCQDLVVNVVIPQIATGRFVGEPTDQQRDVQLLGRDHVESMGLGAWQSDTACN